MDEDVLEPYVIMLLRQLKVVELELSVITSHSVLQIDIPTVTDIQHNIYLSQFYYTDVIDFVLRLFDNFLKVLHRTLDNLFSYSNIIQQIQYLFCIMLIKKKRYPYVFSKSTLDYSAGISVESTSAVGNSFAFTSSVISASNSGWFFIYSRTELKPCPSFSPL